MRKAVVVPPFTCGSIDVELEIFNARMAQEGIKVLRPFMSFTTIFDSKKTQNMLALMLGPHYKGLQRIRDCVGGDAMCQVVVEYDVHVLPSLLSSVVLPLPPGCKHTCCTCPTIQGFYI